MTGAKKIWFTDERIFMETTGGDVCSQPLRFFPRLRQANDAERSAWRQSYFGLHWEALGEDISFDSFTWGDNDPEALHHFVK